MECDKWPEEIEQKIEELEKLEIISDNPIKKNDELYKIEIINLDITIKTQDSTYSLEDLREL